MLNKKLHLVIVGRPNVGKSSLFNRLVSKQIALVSNISGVTRDNRYGNGSMGEIDFTITDTGGFEDTNNKKLENRVFLQIMKAIKKANIILFMIDIHEGVTPIDKCFANIIRYNKIPIILLCNKSESKIVKFRKYEAYSLGLGEPIGISAIHGHGIESLANALQPFYNDIIIKNKYITKEKEINKFLTIAVVGCPNVGKSTLINTLINEDRMLTGSEVGTTHDSISINWKWKDNFIKLIDTAGIRKKTKIKTKLEKLVAIDCVKSIKFAEVVVIILDSTIPLKKQDILIINFIENEGRALIIVLNKWDLIKNKINKYKEIEHMLNLKLKHIAGVTIITMSGLTGNSVDKLMPAVLKVYNIWNKRILTSSLNNWLLNIVKKHEPPIFKGRRIKLRYITQIKSRPPTFILFCSRPKDLPISYIRYLINNLRKDLNLLGVPIRIQTRLNNNPYI